MDRSTDGDDFVRIDALVWSLPCEFAGDLDDFRHPSHTSNEDEFVDFLRRETRFLEAVTDRLLGALEKRVGELFELGTSESKLDVFRSCGVGRDEGQADVVRLGGGQCNFCFFGLFLDPL